MVTKSDVADKIVAATFELAKTQGWRRLTLAAIAAESGLSLAEVAAEFPTKTAILSAFTRGIDTSIVTEPLESEGTIRDRLFELLMRRFDALAPHRTAIRAILAGTFGDPLASLAGLCAVQRSMALTLEAAGVSSSGPFGRLRTKALSALYLRTLYMWLRGDGDDDRIMAQLDKDLARAEKIATSFAHRADGFRRRERGPSDVESASATAADASEQPS